MSNSPLPLITGKLLKLIVPSEDAPNLMATFEELYMDYRKENRSTAILKLWREIITSAPGFLRNYLNWRIEMTGNHLKTAFRSLKKNRSSSLINILGLVLGMLSFILIMFYVNFELSYDSFHENRSNIYRLRNDRIYATSHDKSAGCPPACAPVFKEAFPQIVNTTRLRINHDVPTYPDNKSKEAFHEPIVYHADSSFLKIFSFKLLQSSGTEQLAKLHTAVLTQSTAKKYFGDLNPIGRTFSFSRNPGSAKYTVTGVVEDPPPNSHISFNLLVSFDSYRLPVEKRENVVLNKLWGWNAFPTYILLKPGADPKIIEAAFPELIEKYKLDGSEFKRELFLQPLSDIHLGEKLRYSTEEGGNIRTVYLLLLIGIVILIIAWLNYTNLTTAKAMIRAKETGVKKVFGSTKSELIRQFLTESLVINIAALLITSVAVFLLLPLFSDFTEKALTTALSVTDLTFIILLLLSGSVLSGLYPAFVLSSVEPVTIFRDNRSFRVKGISVRKLMVLFQFAASIVLIISTLTVFNQISFMEKSNLGVDIDRTLIIPTPAHRGFLKFAEECRKHPVIKGAALSSSVPGKEYSNSSSGVRRASTSSKDGKHCFYIDIDSHFFNLYGVGLAAGKNFTHHSKFNKSVIINETTCRNLGFRSPAEAVGKQIILGGLAGQSVTVEGVVKDYHHKSLNHQIKPVIYNPLDSVNYYSLKIDMDDPALAIESVKNIWKKIFGDAPFEYRFLDDIFSAQYKNDQQFGKIFRLFTALALLITAIGLFGLISFTYSRRTREVGIRKVLGAPVKSILKLLTGELISLVTFASIIAWPLAWFTMETWLQNFPYRIDIEWWIFPLAGIVTLAIAIITVSSQAIKTSRTNPAIALRQQ